MFDFAVAELVVVGARPGRCAQRSECLPVERINEPVVVDEPGRDDFLLARGTGDRAGGRVVPAGFPVAVASGVVAELAQDPGTENWSYPGWDR